MRRVVSVASAVLFADAIIEGRRLWPVYAAFGMYLLWSAFSERVTVDQDGIAVRTVRTRRVPWSSVRSFELRAAGVLGGMSIVTDVGPVLAPLPTGNASTMTERLALLERLRAEAQQGP